MTSSIFMRPLRVRRASEASASCGTGSEWTVRPRGSSSMRRLSAWRDDLEPDIKDGDKAAHGPPLEGIAVIGGGAAVGPGPITQQAVRSGSCLLHGHIQQRQPRFRPELPQVEILPDCADARAAEVIKLRW